MVSTRKTNSSSAVNMRIQPVRQCKVTRDPGCVMSVCGACSEVVRSGQQRLVCGTSTRPFPRTPMNQAEYTREGTLEAWKRAL